MFGATQQLRRHECRDGTAPAQGWSVNVSKPPCRRFARRGFLHVTSVYGRSSRNNIASEGIYSFVSNVLDYCRLCALGVSAGYGVVSDARVLHIGELSCMRQSETILVRDQKNLSICWRNARAT